MGRKRQNCLRSSSGRPNPKHPACVIPYALIPTHQLIVAKGENRELIRACIAQTKAEMEAARANSSGSGGVRLFHTPKQFAS